MEKAKMKNIKIFNKVLPLIIALPCVYLISSCSSNSADLKQLKESGTYNEVLSKESIESINNYYLNCTSREPGNNYSKELIWRGYDSDRFNGCYGSKNKRLSTFLNEYGEDEDEIILAYLKNDDITKYKKYLVEDKKIDDNDMFSDVNNTSKIDGKYLYAYQKDEDRGETLLFTCGDISDIKLSVDDYTLVFVAKRKPVTIKENMVTGEKYENRIIYEYHQLRMEFTDLWSKPSLMENDYVTEIIDSSASYVGERIDACAPTYADFKALYSPLLGMQTISDTFMRYYINAEVVIEGSTRYVSLPRYSGYGTSHQIDLLKTSAQIPPLDDIYFDAREDFKNALIKADPNSEYGYWLFDYGKVAEIIKRYHSI